MWPVAAAAVAFVGTHFALSHPLRAPVVRVVGERGFLLVYSLVAFATLSWLAHAYQAAPAEPLWWGQGDLLWALASAVMLVASVLFVGSLLGNPAFPTGGKPLTAPAEARGVYAVTRHPMLWAFALWAGVHVAVYPIAANAVLAGAIAALALVGAALQDRKKERLQPDVWPAWQGADKLSALCRHRAGPRAVRRLPGARSGGRGSAVAGRDLGAYPACRYGGRSLAVGKDCLLEVWVRDRQ